MNKHKLDDTSTDVRVFAPSNVIIERNAFMFSVWKQLYTGVQKADRKTPVAESILKKWNFTKNSLHYRPFPLKFSKRFQKTSTCCIVLELNQN